MEYKTFASLKYDKSITANKYFIYSSIYHVMIFYSILVVDGKTVLVPPFVLPLQNTQCITRNRIVCIFIITSQ